MTIEERDQVQEYQRQGLGYRRIAALTGISVNTLRNYCRRHPYIEDEAGTTVRPCKQCGAKVKTKPHQKAKLYCSDECRMAWWSAHQNKINHKSTYTKICANCGATFDSVHPEARFCNRECFAEYRRKERSL